MYLLLKITSKRRIDCFEVCSDAEVASAEQSAKADSMTRIRNRSSRRMHERTTPNIVRGQAIWEEFVRQTHVRSSDAVGLFDQNGVCNELDENQARDIARRLNNITGVVCLLCS